MYIDGAHFLNCYSKIHVGYKKMNGAEFECAEKSFPNDR